MGKRPIHNLIILVLIIDTFLIHLHAFGSSSKRILYHLEENKLQTFLREVGENRYPKYSFVKVKTKDWGNYNYFVWNSKKNESLIPDRFTFEPEINKALVSFYEDHPNRQSILLSAQDMAALSLDYLCDKDYGIISPLKKKICAEKITEDEISLYIIEFEQDKNIQANHIPKERIKIHYLKNGAGSHLTPIRRSIDSVDAISECEKLINTEIKYPENIEFIISGVIKTKLINHLMRDCSSKLIFKETYPHPSDELTIQGKINSGNPKIYPYTRFTFFKNTRDNQEDISKIITKGIWLRTPGQKDFLITNTSIYSQILEREELFSLQLKSKKFSLFFARTGNFGSDNVELTKPIEEELKIICEAISNYIKKLKQKDSNISPKMSIVGFANSKRSQVDEKKWIETNTRLARERANKIKDYLSPRLKYSISGINISANNCPKHYFYYNATHVEIRIYH